MPESICSDARADNGIILDKFGKLFGNPNSGTRYIFGHYLAPVNMVPGEIFIVAQPINGCCPTTKGKNGTSG
jgi:hypothetical protein